MTKIDMFEQNKNLFTSLRTLQNSNSEKKIKDRLKKLNQFLGKCVS